MQRRRFLFTGLTLATASLVGCGGGDDDVVVLSTRRDVTGLSAAERQAFVDTLHAMKRAPSTYQAGTNAYDYFVATHVEAFRAHVNAHMGAGFLPWHREFLRRFESEMRRVSGDRTMCLPYWDWQQPGAHRSIFTDDFLGGNGDPQDQFLVKTGAFRVGVWDMAAAFDATPDEFEDKGGDGVPDPGTDIRLVPLGLTRIFNDGEQPQSDLESLDAYMARFPRDQLLSYASYDTAPFDEEMERHQLDKNDDAQQAAWRQRVIASHAVSMRKHLEMDLHNPVHSMIGGQMGTGSSPNDPAFFLHHCNVDRLWDLWQRHHGNAGYPTAQQSHMGGLGARLDVYAEDVRVEDTLDLATHSGVRYES